MQPTSELPDGADSLLRESQPVASEVPSVVDGVSAPKAIGAPLVPGQRWHAYQIGEPVETGIGWCFQAVNVGMLDDVIIRVFARGPECDARAKAWKQIRELCHPG